MLKVQSAYVCKSIDSSLGICISPCRLSSSRKSHVHGQNNHWGKCPGSVCLKYSL